MNFKEIMSVKDMVRDGKLVEFQYYRKGNLFYKTECGFLFPVPIGDTGDGQFNRTDRAMLFMRYIRKEVAAREKAAEV